MITRQLVMVKARDVGIYCKELNSEQLILRPTYSSEYTLCLISWGCFFLFFLVRLLF